MGKQPQQAPQTQQAPVERHQALTIAQHMHEVMKRYTAVRAQMQPGAKVSQAHVDAMDGLRHHIDAAIAAAESAAPLPSRQDPPAPVSDPTFDIDRERPGVRNEQASKESESTIVPDAEREQHKADAQRENVARGSATPEVEAGHGRQAGEDPRGLRNHRGGHRR